MYKAKVIEKMKELREILNSKYPGVIVPELSISYSLDSSRTIGLADYAINTIFLNEGLLEEFGDVYINHTLVHEFCHFVVKALYPYGMNPTYRRRVMPHGKEFKKVCNAFGIEGSASTTLYRNSKILEEKRKTLNRHFVKCSCQLHEVSTRMYNIIRDGNRPRVCKKCRKRLEIFSS